MKRFIGNFICSIFLLFSTVFLISVPGMVCAVSRARQDIYKTLDDFNLNGKLKDKNQVINGTCWAFAATAAVEASLAKKNMLDEPLSEKHLLNWVNRKSNESGFHVPMQYGASLSCGVAYFLSGEGAYKNSDCPYNIFDTHYSKLGVNPSYSIRGFKFVESDVESIKKAVSEFGAVCVGYETDWGLGHAVCIVGWNDDKNSWLVKDSGYTGFSYRWLSFNTPLLESYAFTDVKRYDENEKIYQYDETGFNESIVGKRLTCANVFSFEEGETLKSVMISSCNPGAICDVYVAPVDSFGRPSSNKSTWDCVKKSAIVSQKGCFEIKTRNVKLPSKAAIIVYLRGRNSTQDVSLGYVRRKSDRGNLEIFDDNKNSYKLNREGFLNQYEDGFSLANDVYSYCIKAVVKKK